MKVRIFGILVIMFLVLFGIETKSHAGATTLYEKVEQQVLAKGLIYEKKAKLTSAGWVDIHVLKVDLKEPTLSLDVLRDDTIFGQRETLTTLVNQDTRFVGGINASFFSMSSMQSDSEGLEYRNNQISFAKDDYNLRTLRGAALFQYEEGAPLFKFISTDIHFKTDTGVAIYIVGINSIADLNNPAIFNTNAYQTTKDIDAVGRVYKVVIQEDKITSIIPPKTVVDLPDNGYILTFNESQANTILPKLQVGLGTSLNVKTNFSIDQLKLALSGGGLILKNGEIVREGLIVGAEARHPRSAVGTTEDGNTLIAMVVDGRGKSIGATHNELAAYLKEYVVTSAMHLDGGGSSTMSFRDLGSLTAYAHNAPSDGTERPVVNGLGFVTSAEKTTTYNLMLKAKQTRTFINNPTELTLVAYDSNFNPIIIDPAQIAWTMSGGYGLIKGNKFTPLEAGKVTLTANVLGAKATLDLTVVDGLIDLSVSPKVVNFDDGVTTFKVTGIDQEGYPVEVDNQLITWTIDKNIGTIAGGTFVPGTPGDTATIELFYKGVKEVAYVTSGISEKLLEGFASATVGQQVYPETVIGTANRLSDGAIQINYQFEAAEFSQAVYATLDGVTLSDPVDHLKLESSSYPSTIMVRGHLKDSKGETYTITFDPAKDNKAKLPSGLSYPISLVRLYVVSLPREVATSGNVIITRVKTLTSAKAESIGIIKYYEPVDALYNAMPSKNYTVRLFGSTAGRNRLLDEVVMRRLYQEFNKSDLAIYAGQSTIDTSQLTNDYLIYQNQFVIKDLPGARIITLGMGSGSMVRTDSSQWKKLNDALATSKQSTIIILGTEKLLANEDKTFSNEGQLIHDTLKTFLKKSGKTIFYVNASGYDYQLSFFEGVRYLDLNGLWYKVEDNRSVDLYDSFQTLEFTFDGSKVSYRVVDLYPKTTVE